jgi:hypothetical protein
MKKTAQKSTAHKSVTKPVRKSTQSAHPQLKKLLLILAAVLLILFVLPSTKPTMANLLAQSGLFKGSALVTWPKVEGAVSYNIYYKRVGSRTGDNYTHAVRSIPANMTSYTITGLKRGKTYEYKISAVDASGKEFLWSTFEPTSEAK